MEDIYLKTFQWSIKTDYNVEKLLDEKQHLFEQVPIVGSLSHSLHTVENGSANVKHENQSYDYIIFPFHFTLLCMLIILCCLSSLLPIPSSSEVNGMAFPHQSITTSHPIIGQWHSRLWLWEQKILPSIEMQNCHDAIYFYPFKHYLGLKGCYFLSFFNILEI